MAEIRGRSRVGQTKPLTGADSNEADSPINRSMRAVISSALEIQQGYSRSSCWESTGLDDDPFTVVARSRMDSGMEARFSFQIRLKCWEGLSSPAMGKH